VSSRKEQKEQARLERERREAEAAREAARRRRAQIIAGVVSLVVIAGAAIAIASSGGGSKKDAAAPNVPLATAAKQAGCKLISEPSEGNTHISGPFHYKLNPPASGNHDPTPASDGEYTSPPNIGHLVHSLEHGRVIIWYKPGAPAATVAALRTVFNATSSDELLTPNPTGMSYEVAASAWTGNRNVSNPPPEVGHVMGCPRFNANVPVALRAFIAQFKDQGPERQFAHVPE